MNTPYAGVIGILPYKFGYLTIGKLKSFILQGCQMKNYDFMINYGQILCFFMINYRKFYVLYDNVSQYFMIFMVKICFWHWKILEPT